MNRSGEERTESDESVGERWSDRAKRSGERSDESVREFGEERSRSIESVRELGKESPGSGAAREICCGPEITGQGRLGRRQAALRRKRGDNL